MKKLVTGGAGFIGSHVNRRMVLNYPEYHIFNLDALTYAGNLENLIDIEGEKIILFSGAVAPMKDISRLFSKNTALKE